LLLSLVLFDATLPGIYAICRPTFAHRGGTKTQRLDNGEHSRFMQLQEENGGAGRNRTHSVLKESASCRNYESIKRTKRIKIHPLTHGLTHEMPSACVEAGSLGLWSTSKEELCTAIHSNSQLTDCFVSLAIRRAAHDCIT